MDRYKEVVSFANQANISLANHNYQDALEVYASALEIARELERSRLVAVLFNRMNPTASSSSRLKTTGKVFQSTLVDFCY